MLATGGIQFTDLRVFSEDAGQDFRKFLHLLKDVPITRTICSQVGFADVKHAVSIQTAYQYVDCIKPYYGNVIPVTHSRLRRPKTLEQFEFFPELNPLQILLLVFVEFGLTTPYDLLSKAGLGPGLTSPALKRLKEGGLLTSTPGPRNRMRYAITDKGAQLLHESLKPGVASYWQLGKMDNFESLPRGIILAWLHSGVDEAHQGVDRARHNLLVLTERRQREAQELRGSLFRLQADLIEGDPTANKGALIATAYQWIKAECDATLFRLQAEAIKHVHTLVADLPRAPRARRDKKRVR